MKPRERQIPVSSLVHLSAENTHLFRGARLRLEQRKTVDRLPGMAQVRFSDGVVVEAAVTLAPDDALILELAAYRTATATSIAAKGWIVDRLKPLHDGAGVLVLGRQLP